MHRKRKRKPKYRAQERQRVSEECCEEAHLVDTGHYGNLGGMCSVHGRGHMNLHWHRHTFDCSCRHRNLAYILTERERERARARARERLGKQIEIAIQRDSQEVPAMGQFRYKQDQSMKHIHIWLG